MAAFKMASFLNALRCRSAGRCRLLPDCHSLLVSVSRKLAITLQYTNALRYYCQALVCLECPRAHRQQRMVLKIGSDRKVGGRRNASNTLALKIGTKEILMGAPIGCPNPRSSTVPNVCQNLHLNWGTHKTRTRGSISRTDKIASD
jgi:hypothetical protein